MNKGFSLLEMVIALGLLALLITPIAMLFSAPAVETLYYQKRQLAINRAGSLLAEIGTRHFEDPDTLPNPPSANFGHPDDDAEISSNRQTWDDLDDYHDLQIRDAAQDISWTVKVYYVAEPLGTTTRDLEIVSQATDFKLVEVSAGWSGTKITINRVFANFYPAER